MMYLFHTIAYSLDNFHPDELANYEDQFKQIVLFCMDAVYRHEIVREDINLNDRGNILVDSFDLFEENSFIDMHELLSALEIIDSYYTDEIDSWILNYSKHDVFLKFLVNEFKRKGELLTIIDLRDDPEPYYSHTYPILIGINGLIGSLTCKNP